MLLPIWLIGIPLAFIAWTYVSHREDARFRADPEILNHRPYYLGIYTSFIWPIQLVVLLFWAIYAYAANAGEGKGVTLNAEKSALRKTARELGEYKLRTQETLGQLLTQAEERKAIEGQTSDPDHMLDLSTELVRNLAARSIEADLVDASTQRALQRQEERKAAYDFLHRQTIKLREMGLLDPDEDPVPIPDILDKDGNVITKETA